MASGSSALLVASKSDFVLLSHHRRKLLKAFGVKARGVGTAQWSADEALTAVEASCASPTTVLSSLGVSSDDGDPLVVLGARLLLATQLDGLMTELMNLVLDVSPGDDLSTEATTPPPPSSSSPASPSSPSSSSGANRVAPFVKLLSRIISWRQTAVDRRAAAAVAAAVPAPAPAPAPAMSPRRLQPLTTSQTPSAQIKALVIANEADFVRLVTDDADVAAIVKPAMMLTSPTRGAALSPIDTEPAPPSPPTVPLADHQALQSAFEDMSSTVSRLETEARDAAASRDRAVAAHSAATKERDTLSSQVQTLETELKDAKVVQTAYKVEADRHLADSQRLASELAEANAASSSAASTAQTQIQDLTAKTSSLQAELTAVSSQLDDLRATNAQQAADLATQASEVARQAAEIENLTASAADAAADTTVDTTATADTDATSNHHDADTTADAPATRSSPGTADSSHWPELADAAEPSAQQDPRLDELRAALEDTKQTLELEHAAREALELGAQDAERRQEKLTEQLTQVRAELAQAKEEVASLHAALEAETQAAQREAANMKSEAVKLQSAIADAETAGQAARDLRGVVATLTSQSTAAVDRAAVLEVENAGLSVKVGELEEEVDVLTTKWNEFVKTQRPKSNPDLDSFEEVMKMELAMMREAYEARLGKLRTVTQRLADELRLKAQRDNTTLTAKAQELLREAEAGGAGGGGAGSRARRGRGFR